MATMLCYLTEDRAEADRVIQEVVSPAMNRPAEELAERLLIGPVEACVEKVDAYRKAGLQRMLLWPVADELHQLQRCAEHLGPLVAS
jgi:hypothetical protein